MTVTPDMVAAILKAAPAEYKQCHDLNAAHPAVSKCKLGAVFSYDGDYWVYVGINGRNRVRPIIAVNTRTRARHKFVRDIFARVIEASR